MAPSQKTPTNVEPVRFSVSFSEPVTGFAAGDVVPSLGVVSELREVAPNDGTMFEISVSSLPSDGPVCISIPAGAVVGLDGSPSLPSSDDAPCVAIDRTPPLPPEVSLPADGSATLVSAPKFTWAPSSDPSGIKTYRIVIDGPTARDTYTTRNSYSPSLSEGIYIWRLNCRDQAGNVSCWTTTRTLVVDRTPPAAVSIASSSHSTDVWTRVGEISIEAAGGVDASSGTAGFEVAWDRQSSWTPSGEVNREPSWCGESFSPPEDGTWWCHVGAVDRAGNRGPTTHLGPFCVDRIPPTLAGTEDSIRLPNDPSRLSATADWSSVTVADALDPHPSICFSVPTGSPLPMGRSDVVVTLEDRAGNVLVRTLSVVVYNTEPPDVRVVWPTAREALKLGEPYAPRWSLESLAPIASVRVEGVIEGFLDTRAPGRHQLTVTVKDVTGLEASASVEYMVCYVERTIDVIRVCPNGSEQSLWTRTSTGASGADGVEFRSSEWLRIRCQVDPILKAIARAPVTFSLLRTDPAEAARPIIERIGLLVDDGSTYATDIPLVPFRPGQYTLWIGFVDGSSASFSFRLIR